MTTLLGALVAFAFLYLLELPFSKRAKRLQQEEEENEKEKDVENYARKGVEHKSLFFHVKAYCTENDIEMLVHGLDVDDERNPISFIKRPDGFHFLPGEDGGLDSLQLFNCIGVDIDNPIIDHVIQTVQQNHQDVNIGIMVDNKNNVKWVTVTCTMEADPTEEDARGYIPSFINNVLIPVRRELNDEYNKEDPSGKFKKYPKSMTLKF